MASPSNCTVMLLEITPKMEAFFKEHCDKTTQKKYADAKGVSLDDLMALVESANKKKEVVKLHELVEGSTVVERVPPPKQQAKLSELEKMRLHAEERAYQRSVEGVGWLKEMKKQENRGDLLANNTQSMQFASNFLMVLVGSGLTGYYLCQFCWTDDFTTKVLCGGFFAVACLIMEVGLFIIWDERQRRKLNKDAEARSTILGAKNRGVKKPSGAAAAAKSAKTDTLGSTDTSEGVTEASGSGGAVTEAVAAGRGEEKEKAEVGVRKRGKAPKD
eukprot:GDKI01030193.1.p1 GENE.GDKI01030193.1~~GDKI01030193.1.p1  ORF type:complete len:274 (+),score=81.17 GDKI01030193.1:65-886(+)